MFVADTMGKTATRMAVAALIFVIWVTLGVLVIGLLNLAKWVACSPKRLDPVDAGNARTWPAPQPAPTLEPAATAAMQQAPSRVRRVDFEPFAPR